MVAIQHETNDAVSLHGMAHFMETQGLPEADDGGKVGLVYGKMKSRFEYTVRVSENDIKPRLAGWLKYGSVEMPVFEETQGVQGHTLAMCSNHPCVGETGNEVVVGFDVFREIGRILSGSLDSIGYTDLERERTALMPMLDFYERILLDCIRKTYAKAGIPLVRKANWPQGRTYALCLTHDVDEVRKTYQHITSPVKYALMGQLGRAISQFKYSVSDVSQGKDPYWTFETMMRVEEELGVRSSVYFLQENGGVNLLSPKTLFLLARRYRFNEPEVSGIIKRLIAGGWEVGVHGSYYSYLSENLFRAEKESLEKETGSPVVGTRQHHLNLNVPDTWRIHESCGVKYDTSLGFKNRVGFRWGTCFPFQPFDSERDRPLGILEIPTSIMDTPLFYVKGDPWDSCGKILAAVREYGGVLNVLWHHTVYNEREFPGWTGRYKRLVQTAQQNGAWVTHGRDISEWWVNRRNARFNVSNNGGKTMVECGRLDGLMLEVTTTSGSYTIKPETGRFEVDGGGAGRA